MRWLANIGEALAIRGFYALGNLRAGWLGVRVSPGARISPRAQLAGAHAIGRAAIGSGVTIGEGSYVGSGSVMSGRIGRWCSIGYEVVIGPSEHDPDAATLSPVLARRRGLPAGATERQVPPPVIEDEVWIGAGVIVLRGVRIGHGAVIAAGAVVATDVPAMEVWGGVPAKRLRARRVPAASNGSDDLDPVQAPDPLSALYPIPALDPLHAVGPLSAIDRIDAIHLIEPIDPDPDPDPDPAHPTPAAGRTDAAP